MRCILLASLASLMLAAPAQAQQRVVVVPAGAEVAIPARGDAAPPLVRAPRPRLGRGATGRAGSGRQLPPGGDDVLTTANLAVPALVALPIVAAAAAYFAASSTPGSGSGTSAPARTR